MEKYGLLLDVDCSNRPILPTANFRPPFETFRQFRSPSNQKEKKWSSKDRADAGVNIKLYSSLTSIKCQLLRKKYQNCYIVTKIV